MLSSKMITSLVEKTQSDGAKDRGVDQNGMPLPDVRKMKPKKRSPYVGIVTSIIISLALFGAWYFMSTFEAKGKEVPMGDSVRAVVDGDYEKIILKDDYIIIENKKGDRSHSTIAQKTSFYELLEASGVQPKTIENDFFERSSAPDIWNLLSLVILSAGLVLVFMMVRGMQSSGGKIMDFGQSKAKLIFGKKTGVKFEDVAGIDDVKEELVEVVDFLKNPKKYLKIGARIPRGVLLVGAPGTGKTLLAKAVAGEAGVPFFHTSGSEFEEMLVGAGASRVRDLFKKAKNAAPCIIFIDEIDAVAKKRGTVLHTGSGEQTLNQILVEMDGLEGRENVIILAATNRPDVLDPAILRPGRFDRTVVVRMPDKTGRLQILMVHAKGKKFEDGVDLELIAKKTVGYSGADLENLLNEAAIMAARDNRSMISSNDLLESYLKVKLGRRKRGAVIDNDIERIAFHEAGHAVVARYTPGSHPVEKISIISRGQSGGVTVFTPEDEQSLDKKSDLVAMITSGVAGKVAEELFLEEMTTGASGDITQVTDIARAMVQRYGMSERVGFVKYGNAEESSYLGYQYGGDKEYSEETAQMIDQEVRELINEAQVSAKKILVEYSDQVRGLVKLLLEKEEVDRAEFEVLFVNAAKDKPKADAAETKKDGDSANATEVKTEEPSSDVKSEDSNDEGKDEVTN